MEIFVKISRGSGSPVGSSLRMPTLLNSPLVCNLWLLEKFCTFCFILRISHLREYWVTKGSKHPNIPAYLNHILDNSISHNLLPFGRDHLPTPLRLEHNLDLNPGTDRPDITNLWEEVTIHVPWNTCSPFNGHHGQPLP